MHRDAFLRFVQGCTDAVIPADHRASPPRSDPPTIGFAERIAELTKGNAEIYHYDTTNQAYRDLGFYYDAPHLNRKGARVNGKSWAGFLAALIPRGCPIWNWYLFDQRAHVFFSLFTSFSLNFTPKFFSMRVIIAPG